MRDQSRKNYFDHYVSIPIVSLIIGFSVCYFLPSLSYAQELSFGDNSDMTGDPSASCDPNSAVSCAASSNASGPRLQEEGMPFQEPQLPNQTSSVFDQPFNVNPLLNDNFSIDQLPEQQQQQQEPQQQQLQELPDQQLQELPDQSSPVFDQPQATAPPNGFAEEQQFQPLQQQQDQLQQQSEQMQFAQQSNFSAEQLQQQQGQFFETNQPNSADQGLFGAPTPQAASTNINLNDTDNDDLLDVWETTGMDLDNNGVVELDLKKLGADPNHKDIFVEVDFMQLHRPFNQSLDNVTSSFANAPVTNPDGTNGIRLHIEVDEELPHRNDTSKDDLVLIKASNFGTAAQRADPAAILAKSLVYHYALFAHGQPGTPSSGLSNGIISMEFMITLSTRGQIFLVKGHPVGTVAQQEGTFMHELGHNLGLNHGGNDTINCKPNYLSVMTHDRQLTNFLSNRPLDYSRSELNRLSEGLLNENGGVSPSTPPGLLTIHGPPSFKTPSTGIPLDWNRNGIIDATGVSVDINFMNGPPSPAIPDCDVSPNQPLTGFNDWEHLIFSQPAKDLKVLLSTIAIPVVSTVPNLVTVIQNTFGIDTATSSGAALASNKIIEVSKPNGVILEQIPLELTLDDVRNSRIAHLGRLNEFIALLPDDAFQSGNPPTPPSPTSTCDPASPMLELNSRGDKVMELQTHMTALGYGPLLGPPGIDGIYGPFTEGAVKQYQTDHQLLVDGKVGPETWGSICASISSLQVPVGQISDPRTILLGMTDPETSELSGLLLSDKLEESINLLLQIRSLTDGTVGGNAENDIILGSEAQREALAIIDNAIGAIEQQGPGYDEQGNFKSSIPTFSTDSLPTDQPIGIFDQEFNDLVTD
jgi:peptidoglycan hydrolase-like protein with peptidoglycan-binding domain